MNRIRVMIVDDERSARNEIRRLLAGYPDLEIVAEANNADEAIPVIDSAGIDILFLDIQLPGKSGFELLESLVHVPRVIFITAFDQYAVKAFEVSALDYLMKPVREERFARAIAQVRQELGVLPEDRLFVRDGNRYHFIRWDTVFLIESMENYARLYFEDKKVMLKSSLNALESRLDQARFFRVNRAQMINIQYISKIHAAPDGKSYIDLVPGQRVTVSERQWVKFKNIMDTGHKFG